MTLNQLVMVGAGLFAVIVGVVFIIFREQVAQRNRKNIEAKFGQNFGGSKRSTPSMMVWLGALFIGLGAGILAKAIWVSAPLLGVVQR